MANHHANEDRALDAILRTSRLKPHANGNWQIVYSIPEGSGWRQKPFSTGTKDFAQAQKALTEWLTSAQEKRRGSKDHTVGSLIDIYLAAAHPETARREGYTLHMVRQMLGGMSPKDITQQVVRDYCKNRVNQRAGGPLKDGTLRRELGAMLTAIKHAIDQRIISNLDGPAKITLPENSPPRPRWMNKDEEQKFWNAAQAHGGQIALFVALGLETAARKSAILGLTWDRVDFRHGLIDYQDPAVRVTRKRRAIVPMSERLRPVLEKAQITSGGHGPLFNSKLRTNYETWTRRIGMAWVTAHIMRHTWASLAASNGESLFHIAKMLGDNITTVEKTYAKLSMDDLRAVVNRRWVKV